MGNTASQDGEGNTSFSINDNLCGSIFDTLDEDRNKSRKLSESEYEHYKNYRRPEDIILPGELCHSRKSTPNMFDDMDEQSGPGRINPTSALFARALLSEVTNNPQTMKPAAMAAREKRLLKAQDRARRQKSGVSALADISPMGGFNFAFKNSSNASDGVSMNNSNHQRAAVIPPNQLSENRAQLGVDNFEGEIRRGKHTITIGLSLSRRHSTLGHPDTVTRQTAFDFNELQDRSYKFVSSTDSSGWRAGGGERGGNPVSSTAIGPHDEPDESDFPGNNGHAPNTAAHKVAAPDTVHIPIITIDAESPAAVDKIINSLARGEVFIPHMAILPEALSVNGVSPPDLVVRFGCERNDDLPPDEWPNWCLEFMHNQLYEYFLSAGARYTKRPFQITLAKKVRWRTVKHMNKFFAHSERVINAWREKGPQYLNPQLSYIEGGATPEEVSRPHGIYLLRNGRPANYFPPNFEPPYTTKMTRSLLMNVISKSWDKKRRDWSSEPIPRVVTPGMLMATVCGCGDGGTTGFVASDETVEQQQEAPMRNLSNKMGAFYAPATNNDHSSENDQHNSSGEQHIFRSKDHGKEGITSTGSKGSHSVSSMQRKRDNHSPEIGISHSQGSASVYSSKGGKGLTSPGRINLQGTVSGDRSSGAPSFDHDTTGSSDSMDVRQRHQSIGKSKSTSSGRSYGSGGYPNLSMRSDGSSPSRSPSSERVRRNGNLDHLNLLPSTSQENYHHSSDDEHPPDNKNDSSLSEQILQNHNSMNDTTSPPPSEMGVTSVCESNTTIPIANHSPKAFDKKRSKNKFRDRRKRWGDVDSVLRSNNYPTHDIIEQDEDFREGMVEMNGHDVENSSKGSKSSKVCFLLFHFTYHYKSFLLTAVFFLYFSRRRRIKKRKIRRRKRKRNEKGKQKIV